MTIYFSSSLLNQGICQKFGSAGAVCSIEENSGSQNMQVSIVLKASKSTGAKGDVPKFYGFMHIAPAAPMLQFFLPNQKNGHGLPTKQSSRKLFKKLRYIMIIIITRLYHYSNSMKSLKGQKPYQNLVFSKYSSELSQTCVHLQRKGFESQTFRE